MGAPLRVENIIPIMTADNLPAPYVASADSVQTSTDRYAYKAFDNNLATMWHSNTPHPHWLRIQLPTARIVTRYSVTTAAGSYPQPPNTWQFQGSNNGTDWTTLDSQSGQFAGRPANETWDYDFTNMTPYRFYRMYITSASGPDYGYCAVARLRLFYR